MNQRLVGRIIGPNSAASISSLLLLAHVIVDHLSESAFSLFPELFVVRGFFADHEPSATITGVKPYGGGSGASTRTVESYSSPSLHEQAAWRKLGRFLVLHAHQSGALIILQHPNGTDGHFGPSRGLTHGSPVPSRKCNQTREQERRQHNRHKDSEGLFQVSSAPG
jgi:hypothetical protein